MENKVTNMILCCIDVLSATRDRKANHINLESYYKGDNLVIEHIPAVSNEARKVIGCLEEALYWNGEIGVTKFNLDTIDIKVEIPLYTGNYMSKMNSIRACVNRIVDGIIKELYTGYEGSMTTALTMVYFGNILSCVKLADMWLIKDIEKYKKNTESI